MTLLIACLLIAAFHMPGWLYAIAALVWIGRIIWQALCAEA